MIIQRLTEASPKLTARIAAVFYVMVFVLGIFSLFVRTGVGVAAGLIAGVFYIAVNHIHPRHHRRRRFDIMASGFRCKRTALERAVKWTLNSRVMNDTDFKLTVTNSISTHRYPQG